MNPEVIQQAASGDHAAFKTLYDETASFVYTLVFRILGNEQDARDVTQVIYMKLYKTLPKYRFQSSFKTWLYRVSVNTALNASRRTRRDANRQGDFDQAIALTAGTDSPDTAAEAGERSRRMQKLLNHLQPDHRAVLVLREIEGLDYAAISRVMDCPLNTVRSRLKRAREALLKLYTQEKEVAADGV